MHIPLKFAVCLVLIICSSATASPRIGQRPEGICTRDLNPWGNASSCSCQAGDTYDERAGLCFSDARVESIMVQGIVAADLVAIGGETTGFTITTKEGESYELILNTFDKQKLTKLSGLWIEVEGEHITLESAEVGKRQVVIVDKVAVLE